MLKYQLHDYIARNILEADPRKANYYGRTDVGDFLRTILDKGKTEDWRDLLERTTGEPLSARAMMEYFRPLQEFLEQENDGRECSWD